MLMFFPHINLIIHCLQYLYSKPWKYFMENVHASIENSWQYFHVPRKANEIFPCIKWEKQNEKITLHPQN
jgi:hypothetical protein